MPRLPRSSPPATEPRFHTPRVRGRASWGPKVAQFSAVTGRSLMPWQRRAADVALELGGAGLPTHRIVALSAGRRSGKTDLAVLAGCWRCLAMPGTLFRITAQTRADAAQALLRVGARLADSPFAPRMRIYRAQGWERIEFGNGSVAAVFSPLPDAIHGHDSDLVLIDEVWQLDERRGQELLTAAVPSMATRPGPQLWLTSAAGTVESTWWAGQMETARLTGALIDYGLAPGVEQTVEAVAASHPAVGATIDVAAVAAAKTAMPEAEWLRAFANNPTGTVNVLFPPELWGRTATGEDAPEDAPAALGVDVAADRSSAAVYSAELLPDGRVLVQPVRIAPGVAWVPDLLDGLVRLPEIRARLSCVALEASGPARSLVTALELTGNLRARTPSDESGLLAAMTAAQTSRSHARLYDGIVAGTVLHRPDPDLDAAAAGVVLSPGRATMTFSRSRSGGPTHALLAAALAVSGLLVSRQTAVLAGDGPEVH